MKNKDFAQERLKKFEFCRDYKQHNPFVCSFNWYNKKTQSGGGYCGFVKDGREYDYKTDTLGRTLQEIFDDGVDIEFAGYHGDGCECFWNDLYCIKDLIIKSRVMPQ